MNANELEKYYEKHKIIAVFDIDNVLCTTTEAVLERYNELYNDNLQISDITEYWMEKFVKPEAKENFNDVFKDKLMWKKVKPIVNNVAACQSLIDDPRFDVYFCTATVPENICKKVSFLSKWLKNINIRDKMISTTHKELVKKHILFDDYTYNLLGDSTCCNICVDYPWNQDWTGLRFNDLTYAVYILKKELTIAEEDVTTFGIDDDVRNIFVDNMKTLSQEEFNNTYRQGYLRSLQAKG